MPVWINIRTSPIPDAPAIDETLGRASLDDERRVATAFSQGFFVRSLVLTCDGRTLLNPQTDAPFSSLFAKGYFPYAQVKPEDYLVMLRESLRRAR